MSDMISTELGLLLVDDEEFNIKALKRVLRGQGFKVFSANSAKQALELLKEEAIAIVVSDMQMPEVTGDKLLIEIEERWPEVVKIILSGYSDYSSTVNLLHRSSIYRYISKPWDDEYFLATLHGAATVFWGKIANKLIQQSTKDRIERLSDKNQQLIDSAKYSQFSLSLVNEKLKKAYEDEKSMQQKMEEAKRESYAKSRFLATMSHEIRTPLNSIIATNSLLLETDLDDEQIELVKLSHNGATTLLSLINDILDSSKIIARKVDLNESWFNPIHLVEDVAELLAGQVVDRSVEIICLVSAGTPNLVYGDQSRVKQILINLVSNGVKFTEYGCVKVRLSYDGQLRIAIEDTGVGCPEDQLEFIFDEFTQVDSSITREIGGTGLGLSICRQFAQLMGGSIVATSTLEVGSEFVLRLPLEAKQFIALPQVRHAHNRNESSHDTLILTSNREFGEALVELLTGFNLSAHICPELCRSTGQNFVNVLYDIESIGLPDINHLNNKAFNVALVSATGVGRALKLKNFGFDAVLRKPMRLSSLVRQFICTPTRNLNSHTPSNEYLANRALIDYDIGHLSEEQKEIFRNWFSHIPTQRSSVHAHNLYNAQILLAEDSPSNQVVIKSILRNMNASVTIANNGKEAISKAQDQRFDIILMDIAMPIVDGLSATRAIIAESKLNAKTPIIALTANAFQEDRQSCRDSGMVDFISKPVDIYEFRQKMQYWVSPSDSADGIEEPLVDIQKNDEIRAIEKPSSEVIDVNVIHQLEKDISKEAVPGIVSIYIEETRARIPLMLSSSDAKNWAELSSEAHKLKSSSGSFGAVALQKIALDIELNIHKEDWSGLKKNIESLKVIAEQSLGELKDATTYRE